MLVYCLRLICFYAHMHKLHVFSKTCLFILTKMVSSNVSYFARLTPKSWFVRFSAAFLTFPFISCAPSLLVSSPVASLYSTLSLFQVIIYQCLTLMVLHEWYNLCYLSASKLREGPFYPEIALGFLMDN